MQIPREMISPEEDSLQHHTMKIIAENWMLYQEYLHFLPVRHKSLLLSYLAAYTLDRARKAAIEESETRESKSKQKTNQTPITSPLTPKLLHSLFPTDADDVHFLDLSYVRDLSAFSSVLAGKLVTRPSSQHGTIQTPSDTIPDSWDSSPPPIPETPSSFTSIEPPTSPPFAYLTHLSISIPASTRALTTILSHLPRITHLYIHPPPPSTSASTAPVHLDIPRALPRKTLALEHLELPRSYVGELLEL
ncbi:hypothetical protein EX30DRAFT_18502 [Ascodesmis nigricans]|uniref:Uncharacterized protein n=1 Tax=Ascodesmis nigricans TaxID=341454 RepID=A0A4S2N7B9_9PEZI|nr:hypothetical protein EX30DRAFT_18502 [Ascodesmis nigricans]